jgi:hypothetical protein
MKTSLILLAALTAGLASAQQDNTPQPTKVDPPAQAGPVKEKKKKDKPQACSDLPPDQQPKFRMPAAWEQALAKQREEIARRTGIVLPPPPPPKPLPPCPHPVLTIPVPGVPAK